MKYISRERLKQENLFTAGTYGMIKGARGYLVGMIIKNSERAFENFGYCMEEAIIHLTSLGIDTCWIGGVFDRKTFGRVLDIGNDEIVPAVIALGYSASRRTIRDRIVRWSSKGDHRKPMEQLFFDQNLETPLEMKPDSRLLPLLENIRLAPSASNKQPWRIIRDANSLHFYLNRDKLYSKLIPNVDLQRIDMGIALCHFEFSAGEAGIQFRREDFRDPPCLVPDHFEYTISYSLILS